MQTPPDERVLIRFTKAGGHWAEIRERTLTAFRDAIEILVFVDGSCLGGELFHRERQAEYSATLGSRIKQFTDGGWMVASAVAGIVVTVSIENK